MSKYEYNHIIVIYYVKEDIAAMVHIEVFGVREELPSKTGGCGNSGGCDFTVTIGEQYDALKNFLEQKNVIDKVQLEFIDTRHISLLKNKEIDKLLSVGFSLPYVMINKKMRFFGAVPSKSIYEEVIKLLVTSIDTAG
jgi:GMP synthase PP-ATPase subunit